jgi:hypothetical protein
MNPATRTLEISRRILATRMAPRTPKFSEDGPYRDSDGIRWLHTLNGWVLDFTDPASRAELIRRLIGAKVSSSGLRFFGHWKSYTTTACDSWEDAIVLLYEAFDLGMVEGKTA